MKSLLLKVFDFGPNTSIVPIAEDHESKKAFLEICPQGNHPWGDRETLYKLAENRGWVMFIFVDRDFEI